MCRLKDLKAHEWEIRISSYKRKASRITLDVCSKSKVEVKHCNGIFFLWA